MTEVKMQREVIINPQGWFVFAGVRLFSENGGRLLVQDGKIRIEGDVVMSWDDPEAGVALMEWLDDMSEFGKKEEP